MERSYQWVAPNFKNETDNLVLLVIDTDKLENKAVWEVLPHLWSDRKEWIINEELLKYENQK